MLFVAVVVLPQLLVLEIVISRVILVESFGTHSALLLGVLFFLVAYDLALAGKLEGLYCSVRGVVECQAALVIGELLKELGVLKLEGEAVWLLLV